MNGSGVGNEKPFSIFWVECVKHTGILPRQSIGVFHTPYKLLGSGQ
jgi:hypothetical protein